MTEIKRIAVIGAGLMGHGIAQVAAQTGKFEVTIHARTTLDKGFGMILKSLETFKNKNLLTENEVHETIARIHKATNLVEAVLGADLIIESIPENLDQKKALYKKIDKFVSPNAILTSGTSSMNITDLAAAVSRPENFCGMHFFNPPQIMKLVEVSRGKKTSDKTVQTVMDVAHRMGKDTVLVHMDSPGFIVNRILMQALNEAATMCCDGVAERDDIDKAIKLGLNWPMGPLMLIDYIGADTVLSIVNVLEKELPHTFRPSEGLKQMVKTNHLGKKTGRGFYKWPNK